MHKISVSRLSTILGFAATLGMSSPTELSTAQVLNKQRGKAPAGRRFKSSSVYWPGGPHCNVEPTRVKNPRVAANVQMMHEKWLAVRVAAAGAL